MVPSTLFELVAQLERTDGDGPGRAALLCSACVELLGVSGAAIVLMGEGGHFSTLAVSDGRVGHLEDAQFTTGAGPGLDAHHSGGPVWEPDLERPVAPRWPGYTPAAIELGVRAVFALPLRLGEIRLGSLDLFQDHAGPLPPEALADALLLADLATRTLLGLQAGAPTGDLAAEIGRAEDLRAHVHQAAGMISAQLGVGIATAFVRLRAYAYATKEPLDDVARRVVERIVRFEPEPNGRDGDHDGRHDQESE